MAETAFLCFCSILTIGKIKGSSGVVGKLRFDAVPMDPSRFVLRFLALDDPIDGDWTPHMSDHEISWQVICQTYRIVRCCIVDGSVKVRRNIHAGLRFIDRFVVSHGVDGHFWLVSCTEDVPSDPQEI